jgi:hypothetical protein
MGMAATGRPASERFLLVMTACIDPSQGAYQLHRADPRVRLEDYKSALRFWLAFPDARIRNVLFIENTRYPLGELEQIAAGENPFRKRVEFVSLDCNWYPPGGHYGYAELRMLDLGLNQSELRFRTSHMIKVSGRFTFPSLTRLLDRLPPDFDAAADARAWRTLLRRHEHPQVTTQLILFSHDLYATHLQQCYRELESGDITHMEAIYYRKLAALAAHRKVIMRFPCNARPVGFPAHRGRSYSDPSQLAVNGVRAIARRVLPRWWI